ncbi:hypothetical protein Trydic_g15037 [Trypoxylus dichotomus]
MVKLYHQSKCPLVYTFYDRCGVPSNSSLQRLEAKFETTCSINNEPISVCQKNVISENIAAVCESVQENPRQSVTRRAQELAFSQTSTWRILRRNLHPHRIQLT